MANFEPKSFPQIVTEMVAKMAAETPITDFNDGSVVLTLLEAAATEDFNQYIQMLNVIRNYNLDTTEGSDLDLRASEYGLTRKAATRHSGFVTITDTRFTKVSSKIYAGLAGPTAGSTTLFVDDASSFPATGSVYVGRGTPNSEGPIAYSVAPVDNTSFWTITLDVALINDHGTDETVVLSQFGNRAISAGTEVEIPENDFSQKVLFELNQSVELLDGETEVTDVLVTALQAGGFTVTANAISSFPNSPFVGASVRNPLPFVNGRDEETDQELRDRIRETIQSLSRGTREAFANSIVGVVDEETNQSVVSASIVTPVVLADGPNKVFIDNGRGLEPSFEPVGLETAVTSATGGESFFQLENFPISKASLVSQNIEPFALAGTETLIFKVGTGEETFTFLPSDFRISNSARATEISEAINDRATLVEARTITDSTGRRVIINAKVDANENIQIDSASTANTAMNFSTDEVLTLKLYKNDILLTKDGRTATILSDSQPFNLSTNIVTTTDGDISVTSGSRVVTKTVAGVNPFNQFVHPGDYIKVDTDSNTFYSKVRTVISDTKFILEEEYPDNSTSTGADDITIWNSPQLEVAANGDRDETEVVSFSPNDFSNPAQALASEVLARMDAEINLSVVDLAVDSSKIQIESSLQNSAESQIQVLGGYGAVALGFCTTGALTGSVSFIGGLKEVTGVGTSFLTELQEGQWIKATADGNGAWSKIETIENDTALYLTEGYRGTNQAVQPASFCNFSSLESGADKDYVLNRSNGQVELTTPLLAGDTITAGSINTRAFVDSNPETFDFDALGASSELTVCIDGGFPGEVSTGDAAPPYNNFFATDLIGYDAGLFTGFYIEWTSGNNVGETSFVNFYNTATGEFTTVTDFTNPIIASDKFILCQVIDFTHATDFSDPENATAEEVVTAINAQILGGLSEENDDNTVRVRTSNFSDSGSIEIKGGSANQVLGLSTTLQTNQLTNLAYLESQNSDRDGNPNALGYTLGPNQRLVAILDDDSANRTFSIVMDVKGTSTASGVGTFTDTSVGADYTEVDYFKDFLVYWLSGPNEGFVQTVDSYSGVTGVFTMSDVFPSGQGDPGASQDFALVPRTAENVARLLNDLNTTTFSIVGTAEVTGISGDRVQLSTSTPGSSGKVFVTGGSANSLGIAITAIPAGAPVNDLNTNSISGLSKGLNVELTVDAEVTTDDSAAPYDTFESTDLITAFPAYFTGQDIEFLDGLNSGFKTTIASYNNVTGEIVLTDAASNAIDLGVSFRISQPAFITDISGTTAPYTVSVNDPANVAIDVSGYTPERSATIRDLNGLQFSTTQVEGIDGYKYFDGLIQEVQWTLDGLDRDSSNYPGVAAAGTQSEVLTPVLVELDVIVDITTDEGVSLSSVSSEVSNNILEYVNTLGVGDDVILSEIVCAALEVNGVADAEVSNYTDNVVIADGELARLAASDLTVG